MGQVALRLLNRTYRLNCDDGEEERLRLLAGEVEGKLEELVSEFGNVGEPRLLVMAALLLADDLLEARAPGSHKTEFGQDGEGHLSSNDP